MHDYLQAIGFGQIKRIKQKDKLIQYIIKNHDELNYYRKDENTAVVQYKKDFGNQYGIAVVGQYEEGDLFDLEYFYPYVKGNNSFFHDEIHIEKHSDKDSFAAICDDVNIGVPLIFFIHNFVEYLNMAEFHEHFRKVNTACLSGLSLDGTVILNIQKDEEQIRIERTSNSNRNQLLEAAKEGNMEAIEMLTLDDMDTYTMISKRAKREDVYTIVDSYCIPYGVETDKYSILGTIYEMKEEINPITKEELYYLSIGCNNLSFDIMINKKDLLGEPARGRRFKGVVWLQGEVDTI